MERSIWCTWCTAEVIVIDHLDGELFRSDDGRIHSRRRDGHAEKERQLRTAPVPQQEDYPDETFQQETQQDVPAENDEATAFEGLGGDPEAESEKARD